MNLACPIDNKDDSIQKVSAVVASGQSTGTFSGPTGGTVSYDGKSGSVSGYSSLSGNSTSRLAQLLTHPDEPNRPTGFGGWWIVLWIVPFFVGEAAAIIPSGIVGMIVGDMQSSAVWTTFAIVTIIGVILTFGWLIRKDKEKLTASESIYRDEKTKWDRAMAKWNRLYYCHKHDVVFDSENGEQCEPGLIKEFVYK